MMKKEKPKRGFWKQVLHAMADPYGQKPVDKINLAHVLTELRDEYANDLDDTKNWLRYRTEEERKILPAQVRMLDDIIEKVRKI